MIIEPVVPLGATVERPEEWKEARAKMAEWVRNASKAVEGAFPQINWKRESAEITQAQEKLEWYLWAHFYSKTATISDVLEAWRAFYRLHIPGQQPMIENSPTGDTQ